MHKFSREILIFFFEPLRILDLILVTACRPLQVGAGLIRDWMGAVTLSKLRITFDS